MITFTCDISPGNFRLGTSAIYGSSGSIWEHLYGIIWQHLGSSSTGSIWHHLGSPAEQSESWSPEITKKKCHFYKTIYTNMVLKGSEKLAKTNCNHKCEVWTSTKKGAHFTKCFEGRVHHVQYLCIGGPRRNPGQEKGFYHIEGWNLVC